LIPARSANDHGMQLFRGGKHSAAFDAFTEAIRLCPTSPVYHCNRAAAALKLGQAAIAAEDAANAAKRDPAYLRAHLRGGRAHLQLRQPEAARQSFERALELDCNCAAATKGLAEAARVAQELAAQAAAATAAAVLKDPAAINKIAKAISPDEIIANTQQGFNVLASFDEVSQR
jgi:tetratricopeptide (TPR) repeat protein